MSWISKPSRDGLKQSPSLAIVNKAMVKRLMSTPAAPLAEGEYALRVLRTVGRRSGRARSTPVGLLRRKGRSYLVCPDRSRDWAQNLLTEPTCLIQAGAEQARFEALSVQSREAVDIVGAYLSVVQMPWARAAFGLGETPGPEQISAALSRMAVFCLAPAQDEGAA